MTPAAWRLSNGAPVSSRIAHTAAATTNALVIRRKITAACRKLIVCSRNIGASTGRTALCNNYTESQYLFALRDERRCKRSQMGGCQNNLMRPRQTDAE